MKEPTDNETGALGLHDYHCLNGHVSSAPGDEGGHPYSTLVCPRCGATAHLLTHMGESARQLREELRNSSDMSDNEGSKP